jgi:hypothetical protein
MEFTIRDDKKPTRRIASLCIGFLMTLCTLSPACLADLEGEFSRDQTDKRLQGRLTPKNILYRYTVYIAMLRNDYPVKYINEVMFYGHMTGYMQALEAQVMRDLAHRGCGTWQDFFDAGILAHAITIRNHIEEVESKGGNIGTWHTPLMALKEKWNCNPASQP